MSNGAVEHVSAIICGGRNYHEWNTFHRALLSFERRKKVFIAEVIEGGAPGADALAKRFAKEYGRKHVQVKADWTPKPGGPVRQGKYGPYNPMAGHERNQRMFDKQPDFVLAFPGGTGTADMVERSCKSENVKVWQCRVHRWHCVK